MQTKQRFVRTVFTPHHQTELCRTPHKCICRRRNTKREQNKTKLRAQPGWCAMEKIPNKPKHDKRRMHSMRKGFPIRKEPRNHLTPRPVGPKNAPGAKRDGAQTDKTQGYGKVMCKNLNWAISLFHPYSPFFFYLILSVCFWMNVTPREGIGLRQRG